MLKKGLLSVIAVYVVWTALDFVIHKMILAQSYMDTVQLWRDPQEMKMGLLQVVTVLSAIAFVAIYVRLVGKKSLRNALEYGCWFGFGAGVSMGYGFFAVSPIPYCMAFTWFMGSWVQGIAAGLVTGLICRESAPAAG